LDEPTSALDRPARCALARTLGDLKREGTAIVIAAHAPDDLGPCVDRWLTLEKGLVVERPGPVRGTPPFGAQPGREARRASMTRPGRRVAWAGAFAAKRSHEAVASVAPVCVGERVLVTGPNGAGKSTWLRAIGRHASMGATHAAGRWRVRPGEVALVIQEPRRSLFARTVAEEVCFSLERRAVPRRARSARVEELLARFDLLEHAHRSPLRLSFGQQHRLAIAAALAARPRLVLLDEPFAGLDAGSRDRLLDALEEEQAGSANGMVLASHDRSPLDRWCHRTIDLGALGGGDARRSA
jgi:energy-coupling factor transporter ATP-binding protein EcfA2